MLETVVALLAALGLGTVIPNVIGTSKDRREARSRVLEALTELESKRWYSKDDESWDDVLAVARKLEASALIAQVPREPTTVYIQLATVAWGMTRDTFEEMLDWVDAEDEAIAGLESSYAGNVNAAAQLLSDCIWAGPIRRRIRGRRRLRSPAVALRKNG